MLSLYKGQEQDFRLTFRKNLHQKTRRQDQINRKREETPVIT